MYVHSKAANLAAAGCDSERTCRSAGVLTALMVILYYKQPTRAGSLEGPAIAKADVSARLPAFGSDSVPSASLAQISMTSRSIESIFASVF